MLETNTYGEASVSEKKHETFKNVAIIGYNPIGVSIFENPGYLGMFGDDTVGFIRIQSEGVSEELPFTGKVLGSIENLAGLVEEHQIGRVVVAVDAFDVNRLHGIINACEKLGLEYRLVADVYDLEFGRALKSLFSGSGGGGFSIRRIVDILGAAFFLVVSLPLWLLISLFVKLESGGSILVSQRRVGMNGKSFRALKFRTVTADLKKFNELHFATDVRNLQTRFGRMLRSSGLDNLPLLLNILVGDMSFIGPSAERPYYHFRYRQEIPFYENRLKVRPGLVGYARSELSPGSSVEDIREKLKYDFYYVDHSHSPTLNVKILIKSVFASMMKKED